MSIRESDLRVILMVYSVHGEYCFSSLPMPPPRAPIAGRLTGEDMCAYMEAFADRFLPGRIRFETEVLDIRRGKDSAWAVEVQGKGESGRQVLRFDRIVLCTGVCVFLCSINVSGFLSYYFRAVAHLLFPKRYPQKLLRRQGFEDV